MASTGSCSAEFTSYMTTSKSCLNLKSGLYRDALMRLIIVCSVMEIALVNCFIKVSRAELGSSSKSRIISSNMLTRSSKENWISSYRSFSRVWNDWANPLRVCCGLLKNAVTYCPSNYNYCSVAWIRSYDTL